ncbi:MAG: DMT family transporter [Deltaproteobacteria bacterium]|nr:DMT family transporter [Deltaproteobacteria bacterium]
MLQIAVFLFCGLIWGSSYFWIKIALEEVGPVTLVAWRLLFALAGLAVVFIVKKKRPPGNPRTLARLAFLAMLSPGIPFILISWGETRIDSGLASILNGTVPLLTTLTAHFLLPDERMTRGRVVGLVFGFAGILTLFGRDLTGSAVLSSWTGQLAVLAASILYAFSSVYSRNLLRKLSPLTITFGQMFFADLLAWSLLPFTELPLVVPHRPLTWFALAWMGLLASCFSFLFYHWLVTFWGAARSAFTNYLVPLVGLVLGLLVRGEKGDWHLFAGTGLILGGIAIVNYRTLFARVRSRSIAGRRS